MDANATQLRYRTLRECLLAYYPPSQARDLACACLELRRDIQAVGDGALRLQNTITRIVERIDAG